jgi:LacI family transcriptional regulator
MAVTIREVASHAGVSVATVSRALNRSGPVREETRRRVEAAVKALDYHPNSAARSLITRRTRMLGVLLPDLHGEFFSELIRGLDQAAQAAGYHLLVSSSHDNATDLDAALQGMHGRLDGLIVMAPKVGGAVLSQLLPTHIPLVLLNSADADLECDALRIDSFGGARDMVQHLVSHGHRRIAFINGPEENFDAQERLRGYRAGLEAAGLCPDPLLEVPGDFAGSGGHAGAISLLAVRPPPTAIFAANDAMALGALSALREAGVAVPGRMALAGFDDISSARYASPPLTSVRGPIGQLAARAVTRLVSRATTRTATRELLPAMLVTRHSCGCGQDGALGSSTDGSSADGTAG